MPAYYPDLESVKRFAEEMKNHPDKNKRYSGIVPTNESELREARVSLGCYMRNMWESDLAALEIELCVDESNYNRKLSEHIATKLFG